MLTVDGHFQCTPVERLGRGANARPSLSQQDDMLAFTIRIQKNVPMPPRTSHGGRQYPTYPWLQMEIGDSFLFPRHVGRGCYSAATQASYRLKRKFEVHKVEDGWRCWRTA
jgi:hypothetical protein